MPIKLIKAVLEYIFMVGIPVLGIVLMLHAGESLKAPLNLGKRWEVQAENSTECYDLRLSTTLYLQQSGRFLSAKFGKHKAHGKLEHGTLHLDFTPHQGPCAGEKLSLRANVRRDTRMWPAVLESQDCQQCEPVPVMIQLEEVAPR